MAVCISVGMVSKPVAETAPEFQIQQEDFPALPGAQSESKRERERENYQTHTLYCGIIIVREGPMFRLSWVTLVHEFTTSQTFIQAFV